MLAYADVCWHMLAYADGCSTCNRGLLRLATLTNLAAYYRRKGLLNAAHQVLLTFADVR
jgi:hypothetical protein